MPQRSIPSQPGRRSRRLSSEERAYAAEIFDGSIDYDVVEVSRGSLLAFASATAVGNTINLCNEHFHADTLDLTESGRAVLIHELSHVWQFQNGGFAYIASSLAAQLWAFMKTGSRRNAYDWRAVDRKRRPWENWNAEQQAQCIADFSEASRRLGRGEPAAGDDRTLQASQPYVRRVRSGDGAPGPRRKRS
jgi:hypothetical protein